MPFFKSVFDNFMILLKAPTQNPEMIWITLPLVVVLVMITLYFSRYREEELGWNTALGNSLVLIFVSIDLFRTIFNRTDPGSLYNLMNFSWSTILVSLLFIYGIFLLFSNFSHTLPKKIAYFMSSALMVNLLAYVMIALVYSRLEITIFSLVSLILFFIILLLIFTFIGIISRQWWYRIEHLRSIEKIEDIKKEKEHLELEKRHIEEGEKKIKKAISETHKEVKEKKKELEKIKKVARKKKTSSSKNNKKSKTKKVRKKKKSLKNKK